LATPAFPVLGFLYLTARLTLPDAQLRRTIEGRWGTILSFATWTLLPNLYGGTMASLILPCAIGNAIVAGTVYGVADIACASSSSSSSLLEKVTSTPYLFGSGIGATVGYMAPHYMYGPILETMYGLDDMSSSMQYILSLPYITSTSVITGAAAGMILHPLLYYPVHGIPGYHWKYFSGTALAITLATSFYIYHGRENALLPIPDGSFIDTSQREIVDSILRYDATTREIRTYSLYKGEFVGPSERCMEGQHIAETCRSYVGQNSFVSKLRWGGETEQRVVFDDRVLAFVYNYWDDDTKLRHPERVINVKSEDELQQIQNSAALTDACVAYILHQSNSINNDDVMKILNSKSKGQNYTYDRVKQLENVSAAIELLLIMKQTNQVKMNSVSVDTVEKFVRQRFPDLTLYSADELYQDMSVESQLRLAGWKGSELHDAIDNWKSVQEGERLKIRTSRLLLAVSGIILSVAASMLRG
jgi:hypothetical protein